MVGAAPPPGPRDVLPALYDLVQSRAGGDPEASYTARLLAGGAPRIARKVGEESLEVVIAALSGDDGELVAESADLLYHLTVLLAARGIHPDRVLAELARRFGQPARHSRRAAPGQGGFPHA